MKLNDTDGVPAPVPHLSLCASQDDTMAGYPVCDCGADYENATRTAGVPEAQPLPPIGEVATMFAAGVAKEQP